MNYIWDQPQDESYDRKIAECVEVIRTNADVSDPTLSPDPIAFIDVLAIVLDEIVPVDVIEGHRDDIHKVMCSLRGIIIGLDGALGSVSRRECVRRISGRFWSLYIRQEFDSPSSASLYLGYTLLQSKAYTPKDIVIPAPCLPAIIQLIQQGSTSAALSFLILYSIRYRTIEDYPDSLDLLFAELSELEKRSHSISKLTASSPSPLQLIKGLVGDEFLSNLLIATKSLIHCIWNQPQDESDDRNIEDCVKAIRANANESDPVCSPDPIAFIYVFAIVLHLQVPLDVVQRNKDKIYDAMGELADIIKEEDGSSWTNSRKGCVLLACFWLQLQDLKDPKLRPKLNKLRATWDSDNSSLLCNIRYITTK